MCFTIGYGFVRFPDAGILDAGFSSPADGSAASTDGQMYTAMRQPADGSDLQQNESSASTVLPEMQTTSEDAFLTETSQPSKGSNGKDSSKRPVYTVQKNDLNSESKAGLEATKDNQKSVEDKSKDNSKALEDAPAVNNPADEQESPDDAANNPLEQDEPLMANKDSNDGIQDNSLPIESTQDPLPVVGPLESDLPQIQVPANPPEPEPIVEPEPLTESDPAPEQAPETAPSKEKTVEDYWNEFHDSINDSLQESSPKDDSAADSTNQSAAEKEPEAAPAPLTIPSDPNAKEIPPRVREKKSANKDALTRPALEVPKKDESKKSDDKVIPVETFPLDDKLPQSVSYTTETPQELYDPFGFKVPASGAMIVKRLPPIENSVEPIYNNNQMERFAL